MDSYHANINLSKKQGEAIKVLCDDVHSEIGYGGAAGGGKSYLGVGRVWSMTQRYPGTRRFFGRKELINLRKTTLNSYYKFLADYNIPENNRGTLNGIDNTIKFPNGSEIMLLDLAYKPSDPLYTRFGSLELTGGFIDESNEIEYNCLDILKTRLGRQMNKEYKLIPKLLETFNPDKGHIYTRYYKPWKTGTLPEYRMFIPALVTDNKYIDPNYIEQLKKADLITQQRLLHGNFDYDDTEGKLFRYDEILDMFETHLEPSKEKFIVADIARLGDDKTKITYREGLICKRVDTYQHLTTDEVARKIKDLEFQQQVPRAHICIDSDGVGGGVADQLRGCYNFVNNSRPIDTRTEHNFSNLKTQCYYMLHHLAEKREIRLELFGAERDAIEQELDNVLVKNPDKDGKIQLEGKDVIKRKIGRSPDTSDALMMRMVFILLNREKASTPVPQGQAQSFEEYLGLD